MKNILSGILGAVLLSTVAGAWSAQADGFAGHWITHSGTMTSKTSRDSTPCTLIEVWMEQTASTLVTRRYHATCGQMDSDWGPDSMEINGTKITDQGDEIGTLEGDTLLTTQNISGVDYAFNLKLIKDASGSPQLESYYGVHNMLGAIVIEGTLTPAP